MMIEGDAEISNQTLNKRDGFGIWGVDSFEIKAKENSELFENMWKCPNCGRMSMYTSFDYLWHEEKENVPHFK